MLRFIGFIAVIWALFHFGVVQMTAFWLATVLFWVSALMI
jgi:hypothetical protein